MSQRRKNIKRILLKSLIKNCSLVAKFIIFGSPARKSNSRIYTGSNFVLGKGANQYSNIFSKQIKRLKLKVPFDDESYEWVFNIYYNNKRADASIELIFDLMKRNGVITDDRTIRNYQVLSEELDKDVPRTIISIYKP